MSEEWINIDNLGTVGITPDLNQTSTEPQSLTDAVNVRAIGHDLGNAGGFLAVANGDFPDVPMDAEWCDVEALLRMDGADGGTTFDDLSDNDGLPAAGSGVTTSTDQAKFGPSSMRTTAEVGAFLDLVIPAVSLASFTMEEWVYCNGWENHGLFRVGASGGYLACWALSANNLQVNDGSGVIANVAISEGVWHHVAVTKSGSTIELFVDGVSVGTGTTTWNVLNATTLEIGTDYSAPAASNPVFIDEARLTVGVVRYTTDFTPPTEEFPTGICENG